MMWAVGDGALALAHMTPLPGLAELRAGALELDPQHVLIDHQRRAVAVFMPAHAGGLKVRVTSTASPFSCAHLAPSLAASASSASSSSDGTSSPTSTATCCQTGEEPGLP